RYRLVAVQPSSAPIRFNAEYPTPCNPVGTLDIASGMDTADHAGIVGRDVAWVGSKRQSVFIRVLSRAGIADISADIAAGPAVAGRRPPVERHPQVGGHRGTPNQGSERNGCEQEFFHDTPTR